MIGARLMDLLYTHNISQKQLAVDLKIAPSTLNGYINNRREPDYATLLRIAAYFHVSCDYLLGNDRETADSEDYLQLDKEDITLLRYFKNLNTDQQELILSQAKLMYKQNERHQNQK